MKKSVIAVAAITAGLAIPLASPAHAYDREAYAYAAGHMMTSQDVPAAIRVKSAGYFNAGPDGEKGSLCSDADTEITYPGAQYRFSIDYQRKGSYSSGINSNVQQYASATKAIAAFNALKKAAKQCVGTKGGSTSYTNDDGTTVTDTWSTLNTTGSVPLVTIAGVPSIFINYNYQDVSSDRDTPYDSDNYTVYTLVNDVIISTNYFSGSELNLTAAEKKAVNQAAFNTVTTWLG